MIFDADLLQLQDSVRRFVTTTSPEAEVRRLIESPLGYDEKIWQRMTGELELPSLGLPSEFGGVDAGQRALTIVFEEQGGALYAGPYLSTVGLAAPLLLACPASPERDRYLSAIAAGALVATVAHAEHPHGWGLDEVATSATRLGTGWQLDGRKAHVLDGKHAGVLLVSARTGNGIGIFAVETGAGVHAEPVELIDLTRRYAHMSMREAPGQLMADGAQARKALTRALDIGGICLAAEQLGGAQCLLDMATGYARMRTQFGRIIGSFQAIKHMCVDLLLAVEGARSAVYEASWAADEGDPSLTQSASLAQAVTSEAYCEAARVAIQVHGGIGFTWEHPAHLYYRRAHTSRLYLGDPRHHRSVIAGLLEVS
jgi:alkylation response protein AidB-like acyl-CoA dehydrogenase